MQTITLSEGEALHININGHIVSVEHITDADSGHALQLGGVDCDLEGEMPGLYYPEALQKVG